MLRRTVVPLMALLLVGATSSALAQAAPVTERTTIPLSTVIGDNPCTGEPVALEGELLVVSHITENAGGGFTANIFLIPQRVRGVGLVSGSAYLFNGATHSSFTLNGPAQNQVTDTFTSNLVSPGGGGNLLVTGVFHETVDANGEITALVENVAARCVG